MNEQGKHDLLLIQALDPNASVKFNGDSWIIRASIDIGDGAILTGVQHWGKTPEDALRGYVEKLQNIGADEHIVVYRGAGRSEFCWNGAAWQQVTTFADLRKMSGAV